MKFRKLLFLLVLAIAASGVGVWQSGLISFENGPNLHADLPPKCKAHEIRAFTLTRPGGTTGQEAIVFKRVDPELSGVSNTVKSLRAKWEMLSPKPSEADSKLVQRIVSSICYIPRAFALPASEEIEDEHFPFRIGFTWNDRGRDEEWEFAFGDQVSDRRVVMRLRIGDEEGYFSVPDYFMRITKTDILAFQNRRVMNTPLDSVDSLTVKEKGKEPFTLERNGSDWLLLRGKSSVVVESQRARKFVNRLATMRALSVLDTDFNEEECQEYDRKFEVKVQGRGQPDETIAFNMRESRKDLKVSACSSGRNSLFSVHSDVEKYLSASPKEFIRQ